MISFLKFLLKILPVFLIIIVVATIQLIFIPINILGIYIYGQLFTQKDIYKIILCVTITTLLYDPIKIIPLCSWAASFFIAAIPIVLIRSLLKIDTQNKRITFLYAATTALCITTACTLQTYILNFFSHTKTFDYTSLYSIFIMSVIYIIIEKLNTRNHSSISLLS